MHRVVRLFVLLPNCISDLMLGLVYVWLCSGLYTGFLMRGSAKVGGQPGKRTQDTSVYNMVGYLTERRTSVARTHSCGDVDFVWAWLCRKFPPSFGLTSPPNCFLCGMSREHHTSTLLQNSGTLQCNPATAISLARYDNTLTVKTN